MTKSGLPSQLYIAAENDHPPAHHLFFFALLIPFLAPKGDTIGIAATRGGHRETIEVCLETGVPFAAKNNKGRCVRLRVDRGLYAGIFTC